MNWSNDLTAYIKVDSDEFESTDEARTRIEGIIENHPGVERAEVDIAP